jgi:hypothetical protein
MNIRRSTPLVILFLMVPLAVSAQGGSPFLLSVSSQHAAIVEHSPKMKHLMGSYPRGVEVNLQYQTTGSQPWHQEYQYPRIGVSVTWFDYGNPVIGQSLAVSPYLNKSFFRSSQREFNFRLGTGLAFFSNKYNITANPDNNIISSSVNAVMQARFEFCQKLTEHFSLLTAAGINHYSNGATRKPNLGVNLPTLSLGLVYHNHPRFAPVPAEPLPFKKSAFLDISTSVGIKHLTPEQEQRYLVNSASLAAGYRINRKSNLLVGVDGFYDRSLYQVQKGDASLDPEQPKPDVKRVGMFAGHELVLGKMSFHTHLGIYVYRPYKHNTFYYERLELRYHLTKNMFAGADLKVHGGAADVLECRLGVRL